MGTVFQSVVGLLFTAVALLTGVIAVRERNLAWGEKLLVVTLSVLWLATIVLGWVVNMVREVANQSIEEARNKNVEQLFSRIQALAATGDVPDYVLFLRSFRGTASHDTQSGDSGVEALDLETLLARALRPRWLVGLGSRMERQVVGAGRAFYDDDDWWNNFRSIAAFANRILVVPSSLAGG